MLEQPCVVLHLLKQDFADQAARFDHFGIGQPVDNAVAVLARLQHPPLLHQVEMLREISHRDLKTSGEIGDGHFAVVQDVNYLQAGGVRNDLAEVRMAPVEVFIN